MRIGRLQLVERFGLRMPAAAPPLTVGIVRQWMGKGINIITPNKKLSSGPYERYQQLKKLQRQSYMHYFYEVASVLYCLSACTCSTRSRVQQKPSAEA